MKPVAALIAALLFAPLAAWAVDLKVGLALEPSSIDPQLLRAPAEQALHAALTRRRSAVERAYGAGDYGTVFGELAQLRPEVDEFFEHVLVNGQAAQLLVKLMADLKTDQPMAVLTRALGMLDQGLAARQRGQRLGIYDPASQRFMDLVI